MENRNKNSRLVFGLIILLAIFGVLLFWLAKKDNNQPSTNTAQNNQTTPTPTINTATPTPSLSVTPVVSITPTVVVSVTPTTTPSLTPTGSVTPTVQPTGTVANTQVKVYFSDTQRSATDPTYAVWKGRVTNRTDQSSYVIEQLIVGPTTAEKNVGLFTPLKLSGESNCDGQNFLLTMDTENKKATVKFCKTVDASTAVEFKQIRSLIYYDLTQFGALDKVIVLNSQDHCLGDTSGNDVCKQ